MISVKKQIVKELSKIVKDLTGQDIIPQLEHPKDERHGDYSANIAMTIFANSEFRIQNSEFKSSLELAQKIANQFIVYSSKFKVIDRVEAVPPGFINFWLSRDYLTTLMIYIIKAKEEYGKSEKLAGKKIMLEFADPNPFKEFHIGHLRNISLGESYARLLESQGANVWRVNYQGDVGLHVAKSIYGIFQLCHAELGSASKIMENKVLKQVQDDKLSKRVEFLGKAYSLGAKAYEEDEKAKKEIQEINSKVYKNDTSIQKIWEMGRKWSLDYFETIYKRLGTEYRRYYFESEVAEAGKKLVLDHIDDRIFEKSDGAIIFRGEKYGLHNRVFVTKEDYATYEAKDLALAPLKYKDFPYHKSIIITAHEQSPYFKVVLAAMKLVSPDLAAKTKHDSFGFVSLKDTKMSSRLGNIVTGEWLLDEAKRRIQKVYADMDQETAENVAIGAVKYSMLKVSKESDISFSFDESISLEGNSGPYLQYTFARTQSVLRKSEIRNPKHETNSNFQNTNVKKVSNLELEPEELSILRALHLFTEIVEEAAENFAPNIICSYLFDLAQKFNLFYQKVPIIKGRKSPFPGANVKHPEGVIGSHSDNSRRLRIALTAAVGQVMKSGLNLLGIKAPETM